MNFLSILAAHWLKRRGWEDKIKIDIINQHKMSCSCLVFLVQEAPPLPAEYSLSLPLPPPLESRVLEPLPFPLSTRLQQAPLPIPLPLFHLLPLPLPLPPATPPPSQHYYWTHSATTACLLPPTLHKMSLKALLSAVDRSSGLGQRLQGTNQMLI